jgi:hypothetical protein
MKKDNENKNNKDNTTNVTNTTNTVTIDNPILLQDLLALIHFCVFPVVITGLGEVCYWHGNPATLEEYQAENDYILKEYGDTKVFSIGQTENQNIAIILSNTSGKF